MRIATHITARVAFSFLAILTPIQAQAASAGVGVSIHFDIAPIDLFRSRTIEPAKVRVCESLKARVEAEWQGAKRGPVLQCESGTHMPLIANDRSDGTLIVRP